MINKEIIHAIRNLDRWMQPKPGNRDVSTLLARLEIRQDPLGLTLIYGTWNYPFALVIGPLIPAIAGGNVTFIKPSERTPNTSNLVCELISKYLDARTTVCYNMENSQTHQLQHQIDFAHVFFTGGSPIGKIIMKNAARNLCKVTLELGGKNPVFIEDGCDLDYAVQRLFWAKHCNAGQICLSADYILCSKNMQDKIISKLETYRSQCYNNKNQLDSLDACGLVDSRHFAAMKNLIDTMPKSKLVSGGQINEKTRKIQTTIYKDVTPNDITMKDEIFGPIVSILPIANNVDEAIKYVKSRIDKPLGSYIFSNNPKSIEKWVTETSSGGVTVNDLMLHYTADLPFGGVGNSGCGSYHGEYGFLAFTHAKGIYFQSKLGGVAASLMLPPYSNAKELLLKHLFLGPPFDVPKVMRFFAKVIQMSVYLGFLYMLYEKKYGPINF